MTKSTREHLLIAALALLLALAVGVSFPDQITAAVEFLDRYTGPRPLMD